jgi:hypothetical protein
MLLTVPATLMMGRSKMTPTSFVSAKFTLVRISNIYPVLARGSVPWARSWAVYSA